MANAGTVSVDFRADTDRFVSEVGKAQKSLKGIEGGLQDLNKISERALGFLTTGALIAFTKQAFNAADALGDAADRTGIAVESLSRLKFAAEQSDVEFSSLTVGLKKFQIVVSNAAEGGNSMSGALAQIGLDGMALKDLALEDQLGEVANAFQRIQNPADRTRVAVELFGRSGADLIPLLRDGAAGVSKLTAEADRLGITMNGTTARGIGETDKALKRLIATAQGATADVIGRLALFFNPPTDEVGKLAVQISALERERAAIVKGMEAGARGSFPEQLKEIDAQLAILQPKMKDFEKTLFTYGNVSFPWLDKLQEIDVSQIQALKLPEFNVESDQDVQRALAQEEFRATQTTLDTALAQTQKDIQAGVTSDLLQQLEIRSQAVTAFQNQTLAAENAMAAARESALSAGIQALQAFAGQSKKVAIALVLINKAKAIQTAIQNTLAGATLQLSSGDPYTAVARAAAVKAWGAVQVAAIAASGYGEIQSINASGGAASGSSVNPVYTTDESTEDSGATSQSTVQVIIANNVGFDQRVIDEIIAGIREAADDRDVIIFSPDSRQAQEITGNG